MHNKSLANHWRDVLKLMEKPTENDSAALFHDTCLVHSKARIGDELELCCALHRDQIYGLKPGVKTIPHFCTQPCTFELQCGHTCQKKCHWKTPNDHSSPCKVKVTSPCTRHSRELICHTIFSSSSHRYSSLEEALADYHCKVPVDYLRNCGHTLKVECWEELEFMSGLRQPPPCHEDAFELFVFPACKHSKQFKCFEHAAMVEKPPLCDAAVEILMPCGHKRASKCYQRARAEAMPCVESVTIRLPRCGHTVKVPCPIAQQLESYEGTPCFSEVVMEGETYGPLDYRCAAQVTFLRRCGHELRLPCEKAFELATRPTKCLEVVEAINPICGHPHSVPCWNANKSRATGPPDQLPAISELVGRGSGTWLGLDCSSRQLYEVY